MTKIFFQIRPLMVFILFFLIFLLAHSLTDGFWSIDDPYYHAKHSALIAQSGDLDLTKSWIEFHFLNYAPNDPWWGFHLFQAFFIKFFGIIWGVKIAASVLAALFFTIFYLIIKSFSVQHPFAWTVFFFSSSLYFIIRIFLERPQALGMIFLLLFSLLLIRKKYFWIYLLGLIFALCYHFFFSLFIIIFFYLLAEYYTEKKIDFKPIIFTSAGILSGIVIHPDSINYLYTAIIVFFDILYLKFIGIDLGLGQELNMANFFPYISGILLVLCIYLPSISFFFAFKKARENKDVLFLFLLSFFWFILSFFVVRAADYWIPFGFLCFLLLFTIFKNSPQYEISLTFLKKIINFRIFSFFCCAAVLVVLFYNFSEFYTTILGRNKISNAISDANIWLINNTPPESIIFYDDWGLWPIMFFYNDHNKYIAGMDPTLLYEYDSDLFWIWKNLSYEGFYCNQPGFCPEIRAEENINLIKDAFRTKFKSEYIVTSHQKGRFTAFLLGNKRDFSLVYKGKGIYIFKVQY